MVKVSLGVLILFASIGFAQEAPSYGLQKGSIGVFATGGVQVSAGAHPTIDGGVDVGLHKYLGLYAEGGYTLAYSGQVGEFFGGGGLEVTANNRSRIVPFARVGMDYGRVTVFGLGGVNLPALHYGGGFDAYLTRHLGIETQVSGLRTLGHLGGDNVGIITFGMFYRTR